VAYVDVEGTKLYWEDSGDGDPLLLIQGLGFSGAMWFRLLPALEARYRVIRYDARGIGRSDVPEGPYSVYRMADDAAAVLDAAGVDRAHVFGCSLGGLVAQEVGLSHPDRVRSLILCCTHTAGPEAVMPGEKVMDMLRNRATMTPEDAARASIDVGYAATTPRDRIEEDIAKRLEFPTSNEGYTNQLMAGLGYPGTKDRLHQIAVPTLIITGDADQMVPPANSDIIAGAIAGARKVVIPGGGHVIFTDAPDAVSGAMLEFLGAVSTA
jgi:pimeloyl-ACP methyl ester carboxylesterase